MPPRRAPSSARTEAALDKAKTDHDTALKAALDKAKTDHDSALKAALLPRKEDLRECKAIAADADKVILLHNEAAIVRRQTTRTADDLDRRLDGESVDLIVDKNRGGREGKVAATFWPSFTVFADAGEGAGP